MGNIHFTDKEKRIFLAAMGHEKKLCKGLDTNDGDETVALVPIVESLYRWLLQNRYSSCR